jgi:ABC-type molybdenum transport system ATPase subunit/photorepair protein PhrA
VVLKDINFEIEQMWWVYYRNGAGKSTLLKLLQGNQTYNGNFK